MIFDRGGGKLAKNLPNDKPFIRRGTMRGGKKEPRDPNKDRGMSSVAPKGEGGQRTQSCVFGFDRKRPKFQKEPDM